MDRLQNFAVIVWHSFLRVLEYPLDPEQRIYLPYLLTSLLVALVLFVIGHCPVDSSRPGSVLTRLRHFLFPAQVWKHRSTWVDLRYFIPHQMVRIWLYSNVATYFAAGIQNWSVELLNRFGMTAAPGTASAPGLSASVWYTVTTIVVIDFAAFLTHYLQHRIPILWQFHKIHHSAEVLNPLTNYREHPVDNVSYALTLSLATGSIAALFETVLGVVPRPVQLFGVNALMFAFNTLGYHLRHSHIWVRWPGPLAWLLGCPAHHQIHHSCRPEHINRNMAFMFPIWDILFGTYYLPKQQEEMDFGIGDGTDARYDSFLAIYFLPFLELLQPKPAPQPSAGTREVPAEPDTAASAPAAEPA